MIDLKKLQREIIANKKRQGFNTKNIEREFCLLYTEAAEAVRAYYKKFPDIGEELADIVIYALGISEMLKINLEQELRNKVLKNKKRKYKKINGVLIRTKDV